MNISDVIHDVCGILNRVVVLVVPVAVEVSRNSFDLSTMSSPKKNVDGKVRMYVFRKFFLITVVFFVRVMFL